MTFIFGMDFYDANITTGGYTRILLNGAVTRSELTRFEYEVGVFNGTIPTSFIGSLIEPVRTVKFFPATNSIHVINTHFAQNIISVKTAIRALMPSNFITEPHWIVLGVNEIHANTAPRFFYTSTKASFVVQDTYEALLRLLLKLQTPEYSDNDVIYDVVELAIVIRREI